MSNRFPPHTTTTNKHKVIDLRKATDDPDDNTYICEHCDCRLIPYFDIKGEHLTAGKLFQCGKCGQIKDTSNRYDMKRPEQLVAKGDNADLFITHLRQQPKPRQQKFDIDPGDDRMYQSMGFHITKTRIVSGDGRVLRNDDQEQRNTEKTY